jgi:hypothetical protein
VAASKGINPERRREWITARREFMTLVRAMARLGVVDDVCKQVRDERKGQNTWQAPIWAHKKWSTLLYSSIRDRECSVTLLRGFVMDTRVTFINPLASSKNVLVRVETILKSQSKRLRAQFGVFEEVGNE